MAFELDMLNVSGRLAAHAASRQSLIAENVANADTVGFKARDLPRFAEVYESERDNRAAFAVFRPRATRAGHFTGGAARADQPPPTEVEVRNAASPNGNTVSIEDQMLRAAEAMSRHELALSVMRKTLDMLRMSIGRGR